VLVPQKEIAASQDDHAEVVVRPTGTIASLIEASKVGEGQSSICDHVECQHGGLCVVDGQTKYHCKCQAAYEGPHCELRKTAKAAEEKILGMDPTTFYIVVGGGSLLLLAGGYYMCCAPPASGGPDEVFD